MNVFIVVMRERKSPLSPILYAKLPHSLSNLAHSQPNMEYRHSFDRIEILLRFNIGQSTSGILQVLTGSQWHSFVNIR